MAAVRGVVPPQFRKASNPILQSMAVRLLFIFAKLREKGGGWECVKQRPARIGRTHTIMPLIHQYVVWGGGEAGCFFWSRRKRHIKASPNRFPCTAFGSGLLYCPILGSYLSQAEKADLTFSVFPTIPPHEAGIFPTGNAGPHSAISTGQTVTPRPTSTLC